MESRRDLATTILAKDQSLPAAFVEEKQERPEPATQPPDDSITAVDELITAIPGEWKFDSQVARSFDSHVRRSVPLYEETQRMIVELSEWFVRDGSAVYDIGSSTGETLRRLADHHRRKQGVKFIGIETSASMIEEARGKCPESHISFVNQDVMDISSFPDATLVMIVYTLQFLPLPQKKALLSKIYHDLEDGSALIIVDKVRGESSFTDDIWRELHWDYKQRQGLSEQMIVQKAKSLRGVMTPLTLSQDLDLLSGVGFEQCEVFIKWYNFNGLLAVKGG